MNWLKRTIIKWVREDWNNGALIKQAEEGPRRRDNDEVMTPETIRFTLTPAVGGRILRVIREPSYNKNTLGPSDSVTQIYVIPSGEDVGVRVSKIINMELMK